MTSEATVPEAALLPCPFCGGESSVFGLGPYRCTCKDCDASTALHYTASPDEAIAVWNRRAALPHLPTAIHDAALEEAAAAGRRISAELRNAVHPGLGVKYDPRIRDTAANAAMRVVDAIETLKSIPAPAEGNEAETTAAPAQAPGELPWRDMSTAPKDGTHLLVKLPGETTPPTVAHWFQPVPGDGEGGWYLSVQQIAGPAIEPIGWLPIAALSREHRRAVEVSESQVLAFLRRKYTHSSDARQKAMGLEYITAETGDLASEIAKFIRSALAATPVHQEAGE